MNIKVNCKSCDWQGQAVVGKWVYPLKHHRCPKCGQDIKRGKGRHDYNDEFAQLKDFKKESKETEEKTDEPIRDIIWYLNLLGYDTNSSCAGYRYPGHQDETDKSKIFHDPYVTFDSTIEKAHKLNDEITPFFWDILLFEGGFEMHYNLKYGGDSQKAKKQSWEGVRIALENIRR